MNSATLVGARIRGPRLLGIAGALLMVLVGILIGSPGGATAAVGPTDLSLAKTDSADPVTVGSNFAYTILVKNEGAMDAADVVVTDTLPSQVTYVSATASSGTCQKSGTKVTCNLGQVNAGASASVTIVVKASKAGTASNTASLASADDTNAANNQDTETTVVSKATKTKKGKASCAAPTIVGTAGDDVLTGTARADVIVALAGNDQVFAGDGKDLICAGDGADLVSGGPKDDVVIGGTGPDRLFGNRGKDLLKGKGGRDRLRGNADDDLLNGGRGRDNCRGGAGRDTLKRCP